MLIFVEIKKEPHYCGSLGYRIAFIIPIFVGQDMYVVLVIHFLHILC